jgi:ATP-dependent Zn protease
MLNATNPNEASQLALEQTLIQQQITYDWENTEDSPWWSLLTTLLPFVLLMGFFLFVQRRRDERAPTLNREPVDGRAELS